MTCCGLTLGTLHRAACAGASEPRNLGYMVRLGLWGKGSASFAGFDDFLRAIVVKGAAQVAALELVAMDMKAQGMYVCRTLSFAGESAEQIQCSSHCRRLSFVGESVDESTDQIELKSRC